MGKIFPLKEKPSCFEATLKLIERAFQYKREFSFKTDFAPLVDESNHHNCFIYLDENENVLAHIGTKDVRILVDGNEHVLTFLGGIAVDEKSRGQGVFQELFQDVLAEKRSDCALFLLWSDLEKLYNKFGFHLCGTQIEISKNSNQSSPYVKTKYKSLNEDEKKQIQNLYDNSFRKTYVSAVRDSSAWELIEKIESADLFVQKNRGLIESYYFQNKGQDLPDVIYEYGSKRGFLEFIQEISAFGKLWLGSSFIESANIQYQFFMSPGDTRLFSAFINDYTKGAFKLRNINLMKQEVFFDFKEETLMLELPEFLRGVFGPGPFEELETIPFFISGLDSI